MPDRKASGKTYFSLWPLLVITVAMTAFRKLEMALSEVVMALVSC